ncbi:hypothetical protein TBLA_0F00260 [Henningerozyma blattae CBS 6284]|uniref:Uncharacterized protein n=1 Tax=Henningerozyma blattae (strain ATCC 34711 / CBS 6284 / DSM 70876 / NBRC 10599 / NRRL Y-10934 / UCD 77-7) TaxID=1071380 RepID=I2H5B8_HENB6|nr:hypothetical protein TBLA_0F00260 [Tetrapisispora blattae CBS 6284]CCH61570.1 hypothetical protein TBLA_0F00260 [Tetrapisispora blattae CBS 6284]
MLYLTANTTTSETIQKISLQDNESNPTEFPFELICTHCRESHDSTITMNAYEKVDISGSKGEASIVVRCKFCKSENSIVLKIIENEFNCLIDEEEGKTLQTKRKKLGFKKNLIDNNWILLELDCRGCEVSKFHPELITFNVVLKSGSILECQLDENENEWYDYDEDAGEEVSIIDFQFNIINNKGK